MKIADLTRRALERVGSLLETRVIPGELGPYLSKHLIYESDPGKESWRAHLHRFHRSDADDALHNHPWRWGLSVVLVGGYDEDRVDAVGRVRRRRVRPGTINFVGPGTFHRVELYDGECWTLFLSGRIVQTWGFLVDKGFVHYKKYLRQRGLL